MWTITTQSLQVKVKAQWWKMWAPIRLLWKLQLPIKTQVLCLWSEIIRISFNQKYKRECAKNWSVSCQIFNLFFFSLFYFLFLLLLFCLFYHSNSCWFLFSIRVFFQRHWRFTGQQGKRGDYLLFHSTTSTRSQTLRHLFATLHVRWLSRIFKRNACVYQTATRWHLPPCCCCCW